MFSCWQAPSFHTRAAASSASWVRCEISSRVVSDGGKSHEKNVDGNTSNDRSSHQPRSRGTCHRFAKCVELKRIHIRETRKNAFTLGQGTRSFHPKQVRVPGTLLHAGPLLRPLSTAHVCVLTSKAEPEPSTLLDEPLAICFSGAAAASTADSRPLDLDMEYCVWGHRQGARLAWRSSIVFRSVFGPMHGQILRRPQPRRATFCILQGLVLGDLITCRKVALWV